MHLKKLFYHFLLVDADISINGQYAQCIVITSVIDILLQIFVNIKNQFEISILTSKEHMLWFMGAHHFPCLVA